MENTPEYKSVYETILRGDVKCLNVLLDSWRSSLNIDDMDKFLSSAYSDLKLKNVALSAEIKTSVQCHLVELRFYSQSDMVPTPNIVPRLNMLYQVVESLRNDNFVDSKFLYKLKFIARTLLVLKQNLKATYTVLPWEEMLFCLVMYVSSQSVRSDLNVVYRSVLKKSSVLKDLQFFATRLRDLQSQIEAGADNLNSLMRSTRDVIVAAVLQAAPEFGQLYADYDKVRDVYSLKEAARYMDGALGASVTTSSGRLALERALQATGELLKSTAESPHLSAASSSTLLQRAPAETRLLLATLRNSLSHARRAPSVQQHLYDNIKNDIKKIEIVIKQMLFTDKMRCIAEVLNDIILCENLDEINEMFDAFEDLCVLDNPKTSTTDHNTKEKRRIDELLEDISCNVVDKTDDEEKILKEVIGIVNASQDFQNIINDYSNGYMVLRKLSEYVLTEKHHRVTKINVINIKVACSEILKKVIPNSTKFLDQKTFDILTGLLIKFYESVQSRISGEDDKELLDLIFQVHHLFAYERNSVKWIDEFKERLNKSKIKKVRTEISNNTQPKPRPLSQKQKKKRERELKAIQDAEMKHYDKSITEPVDSKNTKKTVEQMKTVNKSDNVNSLSNNCSLKDIEREMLGKISTLKDIFNRNPLVNGIPEISRVCDKLAVEMLVLDILTDFDTAGNLVGSVLFVEDCCPVLTGRGLRNLLAHGNPTIDILFPQTIVSILSNAKFLIENIITFDKKIGKNASDDFKKMEQQYLRDICILEKQNLLCKALNSGHFKSVKTCLNNGGDVNYRSLNMWTSLHHAASAPSIQVVLHLITNHHQNLMAVDILGQTALHIAASHGHTYIARTLIEIGGMRIDDTDHFKRTPLYCASQNGFSETVCEFISLGADCSSTDEFGLNSLHCAAKNNHINVVKVLLSYGYFDVNSRALISRGTPLHYASEYGDAKLVNLLIDNGANVNAVSSDNSTPLNIAASHGYLETVKVLIKRGANVNLKNFSYHRFPLHNAIQPWNNSKEVVKVLLENGAFVDAKDKSQSQTPLHLASFIGHTEIINQLIEYHADLNATRYNNMTPLMCASYEGHGKAVDFLIKKGAMVNMQDCIGYTALHIAAMNGHTDIVKSLIAHGIGIDSKSNSGITPLHLAAKSGKLSVVETLLAEGADVNYAHNDGMTPLHESTYEVHEVISEILILNGANVNAKNVNGMTPLHIAMENTCTDKLIRLLISNGGDVNTKSLLGNTPLHRACYFGHAEVVKYLIHENADVNSKTNDEITPLIVAIEKNHKEIAEILLDNNADVSAVKGDGFTALCCAAKYNYKEIAHLLIERGADVNAQGGGPLINAIISGHRNFFDILLKNKNLQLDVSDYDGNTPLHLAARNGNWNIGKELIKRGVNINSMNNDNMTPLWLAVYQNHKEFVDLLLENNAAIDSEPKDCLYTAVLGPYVEIVESLLRSGANNNSHERNGNKTTLELAVINGSLDIIKLFFKYQNIDVNKEDDMRNTMLHIAANQGYIDIIEFLLDNGADWNHRNIAGLKPLHVAANQARFGSMEYLFERGMDVNDVDPFGITLLHYVANIGQAEATRILLDKGALVNAVTNTQLSPIHLAAMRGHKAVVEILLNGGAIYNAVDNTEKQPKDYTTNEDILSLLTYTDNLFTAVEENNVSTVESLITSGAVNAKKRDFLTPLHTAIKEGNERICEILLRNRANPNSPGDGNKTPLHYAAKHSQLGVTKALLSNGAMYNVMDDESNTPLDLCKDDNIKDLLLMISRFFEMVSNSDVNLLRELNEIKDKETGKVVMRTRNAQNESIVGLAIKNNFSKLVELKKVFQDQTHLSSIVLQDLISSGKYTQALIVLNNVLENRRNIMGNNNPANLDIEREIATILYYQSRYSEALSLHKIIYGKQKELLGRSHEVTIRTRTSVALLLSKLDQPEVALKTFEEIYEMQKEILGDDHEDTLHTNMYTASTLAILGRTDEALNLNIKTYDSCSRVLGSKHTLTSSVLSNTAAVYSSRKEYRAALRIFRMVYEAKFFSLGPDHPDTMKALHNIAVALAGLKIYDEAVKLFLCVHGYQVKRLGSSHIDTIATKNKLAVLVLSHNRYDEAKQLLAEGYQRMKKILGSKNSEVKNLRKVLKDIDSSYTENILTDDTKSDEESNLFNDQFDVFLSDDGNNLSYNPVSTIEQQNVILNLEDDPNKCNINIAGNTTLIMATLYENSEFVSKLLSNNCMKMGPKGFRDILDSKSIIWDATALHIAVKKGSLEIVQQLLEYGARSDIVDSEGKKPIDYSQDEDITKLLDMIMKQREGTRRDEIISNFKERWGLAEITTVFGAKIRRQLARKEMAKESGYEYLVNLFTDAKDENVS